MGNKGRYQLHILSKASPTIVNKLDKAIPKNALWVFAGYCFEELPKNFSFDIIVDAKTSDWNHDYKFKLLEIVDEFGKYHASIPEGYKTVCLIQCTPSIPIFIENLSTDKTWNFKRKGLYVCEHSSIDPLKPLNVSIETFEVIVSMFKRYLKDNNTNAISMSDAIKLFSPSSNMIIDNLIISGSVKEEDNKLVLNPH
jgi:hypothetical protein